MWRATLLAFGWESTMNIQEHKAKAWKMARERCKACEAYRLFMQSDAVHGASPCPHTCHGDMKDWQDAMLAVLDGMTNHACMDSEETTAYDELRAEIMAEVE